MSAQFIDDLISSSNNPLNFLKTLNRFGSCVDYRNHYTPKQLFSEIQDKNGIPINNLTLAFECQCGKLISLKPRNIEKSFDSSGSEWGIEVEKIIQSLPENQKITWVERHEKYFEVSVEIWEYDTHSAWQTPINLFGRQYNFLLSCHDCDAVSVVEIKNSFFRHPFCKVLNRVPLSTLDKIRCLDKDMWRNVIWHTRLEYKNFTAGYDRRNTDP